MGSAEQNTAIDTRLQALVGRYLRGTSSDLGAATNELHLDEDTLAGFTDGNLSMREAAPVMSHLVNCSFCRHKTAELVRLTLAFEDVEPLQREAVSAEPSKISEVLNGILSRLFGSGEAAVFAHEEKEDDADEQDDDQPGE